MPRRRLEPVRGNEIPGRKVHLRNVARRRRPRAGAVAALAAEIPQQGRARAVSGRPRHVPGTHQSGIGRGSAFRSRTPGVSRGTLNEIPFIDSPDRSGEHAERQSRRTYRDSSGRCPCGIQDGLRAEAKAAPNHRSNMLGACKTQVFRACQYRLENAWQDIGSDLAARFRSRPDRTLAESIVSTGTGLLVDWMRRERAGLSRHNDVVIATVRTELRHTPIP
jgi:hypothetical protein